jgi:hypothetical protein
MEIVETIGRPEFVLVLRRHFWPLHHVSCVAHYCCIHGYMHIPRPFTISSRHIIIV